MPSAEPNIYTNYNKHRKGVLGPLYLERDTEVLLEVDWKFGERSAVEVERAVLTGGAPPTGQADYFIRDNSQDGPDNQQLGEDS